MKFLIKSIITALLCLIFASNLFPIEDIDLTKNIKESAWNKKVVRLEENITFSTKEENDVYSVVCGLPQNYRTVIYLLYYEGYKVNEISAKYKAHKIYIQRRNDIILEKLKKGISRKTIEKEMDISKRTIQDVAEANNAFANKVRERDGLILEKIKSGMYGKDIAKELGINEATVWRTVQKYGLTVRELRKLAKD